MAGIGRASSPADGPVIADQMPRGHGVGLTPGGERESAEIAAELAELGLTRRVAWYSSALLYGGGGLVVVVLYAIDRAFFPPGVFLLGCLAILISAACLLAALGKIGTALTIRTTTHLLETGGLLIFVAGAIILQQKANEFALITLLTVPAPCYMFPMRFALRYVAAGALIIAIGGLMIAGPAPAVHVLVSTSAFVVIAAAMIITRQRAGRLAWRNRQLAYTDALTGLANMRSLRERISGGGGSGEPDRTWALFAIDLDDFKQVNDRFDHSLGDSVLRAVSDALRAELEPSDLAVRRGGDEFLVLAGDPERRDLDGLCDVLEGAIARARLATCPEVSPSGTVAYICTRPGEELGAVMERADEALHDAKVASRARRRAMQPSASESSDPAGADRPPPQHPEETPLADGLRGRITGALARSNPDWVFASLLLLLGPILTAPVSIAGLLEPLTPLAGAAAATVSLILALACLCAGIAGLSRRWLHIPWLAAYGVIALQIALAGPAGAALLDLLPAIVMYGFLLLDVRSATLYMLLGDGLYGGFAIGGGFAQGVARTVITTAVVAVVGGLIAKLREFTVRSARKNRQLSELDALTGVGNVRALRHRVSRVIERADSTGLHPALVAIDLDGFKQVNDLYSHSTGDQVLVAVARAVSDHVQIEELVARRGGDEFVVVLRDADPRYADTVARRIGAAISRSRARICPDLQPTASIASIRWRPGETAEEFLRGADLALHERKAESRASGREEPAMAGSTRSASRRSTDGRASTSSTAGRGAGALATAIAHAHGSGNGCTSMPAGRSRRPSS